MPVLITAPLCHPLCIISFSISYILKDIWIKVIIPNTLHWIRVEFGLLFISCCPRLSFVVEHGFLETASDPDTLHPGLRRSCDIKLLWTFLVWMNVKLFICWQVRLHPVHSTVSCVDFSNCNLDFPRDWKCFLFYFWFVTGIPKPFHLNLGILGLFLLSFLLSIVFFGSFYVSTALTDKRI